jgi:hypothetical protein
VRLDWLFRVLFVVYCVEAGLFLLVSPWTPTWTRLTDLFPAGWIHQLAYAPAFRGLVAGFGAVHLIWALHDVDQMLRGRIPQRPNGARTRT